MLLTPCTFVEPAPVGRAPVFRQAVFDADSGITYVETAPDLVTVITANGVQLQFRTSLADFCGRLVAAEADNEGVAP